MTNRKKEYAPESASVAEILKGIANDTYYKSASGLTSKGFEYMTVDIKSAEFQVDYRWSIQSVDIPAGKRGNLAKFACQRVEVIVMNISRSGPRVEFLIRKAK